MWTTTSPVAKVENSNVTDSLHLTLFFGIDDASVNHEDILKHINSIDLKELRAF